MTPAQHKSEGQVVQVIGPVVDVQFEEEKLPAIYNALRITSEGFDVPVEIDIIAEAQQHLGEGRVRCVAMKPSDGIVRGMKAVDTGSGRLAGEGFVVEMREGIGRRIVHAFGGRPPDRRPGE